MAIGGTMKTDKNILVAFILNLAFSIFEVFGGIFTGSVAILSDAIHDLGDALSIGMSYFLEKESKKQPDASHTYGYVRYSVLGGLITTTLLLLGSCVVIHNAMDRIVHPANIHYNGMLFFAIIGVCVNLCAAWFTRNGDSLNQKAVNLHMLEDVLGWVVVLVGSIVIRFTHFTLIDPLMSIGVSLYIFIHAVENLKSVLDLFLVKTPHNLDVNKIRQHILSLDGVTDVHHIHIWSMDGQSHYATMHVVTGADPHRIKADIRSALQKWEIYHTTLELEALGECCHEKHCRISNHISPSCHHHHHHH